MKVGLHIDTPALGDTIAAIPTLNKLSKVHQSRLWVFSSYPELFNFHPSVESSFKFNNEISKNFNKFYTTFSPLVKKSYQFVPEEEPIYFRHSNIDIRQFHAISLGFTLTPIEMEYDLYVSKKVRLDYNNYVLIHPTQTWPTRTWSSDNWQTLINELEKRNIPVVAVGKTSKEVGTYNTKKPVFDISINLGHNLLNKTTIPELRWLCENSKTVVTMDSGLLHLAGTTDTYIIQLGSSINPALRAPWRKGTQDWNYSYIGGNCNLFCSSDMKYNLMEHNTIHKMPPQVKCLENKETFECHPTVNKVLDKILEIYE